MKLPRRQSISISFHHELLLHPLKWPIIQIASNLHENVLHAASTFKWRRHPSSQAWSSRSCSFHKILWKMSMFRLCQIKSSRIPNLQCHLWFSIEDSLRLRVSQSSRVPAKKKPLLKTGMTPLPMLLTSSPSLVLTYIMDIKSLVIFLFHLAKLVPKAPRATFHFH